MKIFFIKPNQKEKSKHLKKGDFKFDINSFYKNILLNKNENKENINEKILKNKKQKIENKEHNENNIIKNVVKKNQIVLFAMALMLITAGYLNYNNSNIKNSNLMLAELGDAQLVSTDENSIQGNIALDKNTSKSENSEIKETSSNTVENSETKETSSNTVENSETEKTSSNTSENSEIKETSSNTVENSETKETSSNENSEKNKDSNKAQNSNIITNSNSTSGNYFTQTRLERENMYSQMLETYQKILENDKIPADQKSIAANEIMNINNRKMEISVIENLIKTKGFENSVVLINDNNINVVVKQKEELTDKQVAQIENIVSRELNAEIGDIHVTTHE